MKTEIGPSFQPVNQILATLINIPIITLLNFQLILILNISMKTFKMHIDL